MEYQSKSHAVFSLKYHLILATKYRRKCISKVMLIRLEEISRDTCQLWQVNLIEFGGEKDHIHLLLEMHPNITPSRFVSNLKTVTSRKIRKEYQKELSAFYWKPVFWSGSYCLISVGGAPLSILTKYIQNQ